MITKVTLGDFNRIKKCMTEEEIKEKYGKLIIKKQVRYENNNISK